MEASTTTTTDPFAPLNDLLTTSITRLRKLAEQNDCIHVWDGDDCALCDLHMGF